MYTATKKTRQINAFKRTSVIKARDIYARYGMRFNPKAIHSTDAKTPADVVPSGSAVIDSMIQAQQMIKRHSVRDE